jgi:Secretion system C-terminal sorting domain
LKIRIQHILILVAILFVSKLAFAQKEGEKSRLGIGQTPKKVSDVYALSFKPAKAAPSTINLKTSYSKYYRDRLLSAKATEAKSVINTVQEPIIEKIAISSIYPNPATQYATIDYTVQKNFNTGSISFYNLLGKEVAEFELNKFSDKLRVNVSNWEAGIYLYQLTIDGRKVSTKKLLVNRN